MKKKGIKGTLEDGPVTEHPFFGRNQWNHSLSHMPRGLRAQILAEERVEEGTSWKRMHLHLNVEGGEDQ
jgi:hypothetical protein